MTPDAYVETLSAWRLTPRQARFVVTVALHSGYCLRRQYMAFAGLRYGKVVREFLDGLVERRLAERTAYRVDRGFLYHLHARALYRALGQDDNRNRRRTSPAAIARKLMLLDYVIAEPEAEWYATEQDKVALFTGRFGVAPVDLPQRSYAPYDERSPSSTRYFMHKLPVGLVGDPPTVRFVALALDPAGQSFEQFLRDHARLLSHLSTWTIVLVGPRGQASLTPCRRIFDRYMIGSPTAAMPDGRELSRYFTLRRAVERHDWAQLSAADLQSVREARARFTDPRFDALYARWLATGDLVFTDGGIVQAAGGASTGQLVEHLLPFRYDQFGDLPGVC